MSRKNETMTERDRLANELNIICPELCETFCGNISCASCITDGLKKVGYRRETDVAAEIFEEIESFIIDQCSLTNLDVKQIYTKVSKMRKHYREKNNG
jgi:hypothetical protein